MNFENENRTYEQQLQSEERQCPVCGYSVANPLTDRCPRCFSGIERQVKSCGGCTHLGSCEFAVAVDSIVLTRKTD